MAPINPFSGKQRKVSKRNNSVKMRACTSHTTSQHRHAREACTAMENYIMNYQQTLGFGIAFAAIAIQARRSSNHWKKYGKMALTLTICILELAQGFGSMALACAELDSLLMDVDVDNVEPCFKVPPNDNIRIDAFQSDSQCCLFTRFRKNELRRLLNAAELPEFVGFPQSSNGNGLRFYKYHREEIFIYMLHKFATRSTHQQLAGYKDFGGSSSRWSKGFRGLVFYLDAKFYSLIGPEGIVNWVPWFDRFSKTIYDYLQKRKFRSKTNTWIRYNHDGAPNRDDFNISMFGDCTVYECDRPGSGPAHPGPNSLRRPLSWWFQRAFFDGHHRIHTIKVLAIYLPNGITAAVYGPTSGREHDRVLLTWSHLDNFIHDACLNYWGFDFGCYVDSIFRGSWHCFRTRHEPILGFPLTNGQINENDCLKSARVSIEMGYGTAKNLFPMLTVKEFVKIDLDSMLLFACVRLQHLFTNFHTCFNEGTTSTGDRMFACDPPTFEEYIGMVN